MLTPIPAVLPPVETVIQKDADIPLPPIPTVSLQHIDLEEGEAAMVIEAAAAGGQTLEEFIREAVRAGIARYRIQTSHRRV